MHDQSERKDSTIKNLLFFLISWKTQLRPCLQLWCAIPWNYLQYILISFWYKEHLPGVLCQLRLSFTSDKLSNVFSHFVLQLRILRRLIELKFFRQLMMIWENWLRGCSPVSYLIAILNLKSRMLKGKIHSVADRTAITQQQLQYQ